MRRKGCVCAGTDRTVDRSVGEERASRQAAVIVSITRDAESDPITFSCHLEPDRDRVYEAQAWRSSHTVHHCRAGAASWKYLAGSVGREVLCGTLTVLTDVTLTSVTCG